jgi:type VI secretion system protein ImpC
MGQTPAQQDHPLRKVDIDSLDRLIQQLAPRLPIPTGTSAPESSLTLHALDDFHPDRLIQRLDLSSITTELEATEALAPTEAPAQTTPSEKTGTSSESAQQTLERLLGKTPVDVEKRRGEKGGLSSTKQSLISDLVHRLAESSLGQEATQTPASEPTERIDPKVATQAMRHLLHSPAFRALETCWRGVDWLLRSVEADELTSFYLLNLSQQALTAELVRGEDVEQTPLYRSLRERLFEGLQPRGKTLLIGDFSFTGTQQDMQLLGALGSLAGRLGGWFIAAADPQLLEALQAEATPNGPQAGNASTSLVGRWQTFRATAAAERIILALPRILLRLPYGENTDPIDAFPFEEMSDARDKSQLLWGNPAFACALLLLQPQLAGDQEPSPVIDDLPAYSYQEAGESQLQPCVERMFSEREIAQLLELGLAPVLGSRRTNSIQMPWLQTLAVADR